MLNSQSQYPLLKVEIPSKAGLEKERLRKETKMNARPIKNANNPQTIDL